MKDYIEKYSKSYLSFPQLFNFKKLWHISYWDGPINGVCEVDGNKCWFEVIEMWIDNNSYPEDDDDFEQPWSRRFLITKLTDVQFEYQKNNHEKWEKMKVAPDTLAQYYAYCKTEEYKNNYISPVPLTEDCILGWYER